MVDPAARAAAEEILARGRALADAAETSGAGVEPAYAPERERFAAYTHAEIWQQVREALDPAALGETAEAWRTGADTLAEAFQTFADATAREFARWSGGSAEAASRATRSFVTLGTQAHEVCRTVQRLIELDRDVAQTIRAAVPPPARYVPLADPVAEAVLGGRRRMEHERAAAEVEADVRDIMTYVYSPTMPATGDSVPRFRPPDPGPTGGSAAR
ncbi:hypothetical protein [Nocardia shimofusensis]|uniref:hypothetical protein n=1 Tax=Nocardia shimofusensis TaxID=228596 RepID=UPI000832604E|nr:hypothetical protein [Nocardia shimofusensis]